jgi:hypothetical protein
MPHRVDAVVQSMKAAEMNSSGDPALLDTSEVKLPNRDHSVLSGGDLRQVSVGWGAFLSHSESKSTRPSISPPSHDLYTHRP